MFKNAISVTAIALALLAYIPYIKDILSGKTKPHTYSWFLWGLLGLIVFVLQLKGGGGPGAYVTLSSALLSVVIFILALKIGDKDIKPLDTIFLMAALIAMGIWLFAKQPTISLILLILIEVFGFFPTYRKSWYKPYDETLVTWLVNSIRYVLSLLALRTYNLLTLLYPLIWTIVIVGFTLMLVIRRRYVVVPDNRMS